MKVRSIEIINIRSFENTNTIELSPKINLLIGRNNSGKSTVLKSLMCLQYDSFSHSDRRVPDVPSNVVIRLQDVERSHFGSTSLSFTFGTATFTEFIPNSVNLSDGIHTVECQRVSTKEPANFVYPFLSDRNKANLTEQIKSELTREIVPNFSLLSNRIDRISNPQHPHYTLFTEKCMDILGLPISTFASANGKTTGLITDAFNGIGISAMGSGTLHAVALIEYLCNSENKLILIEELENDLHPRALKRLLDFIVEKSSSNQFVISTHSNLVCKYLGAEPETKLFEIGMKLVDRMPTSTVKEVANSRNERIRLLQELGYELWDFEIWEAWIFFEESSAERIVRDYLIPWFAPGLLGKVRTLSTSGVSKVKSTFNDFKRLFTFVHLEQAYNDRAWVLVDGNDEARDVVANLRNTFRSWRPEQFKYFSKDNFEEYYPNEFLQKKAEALATNDPTIKKAKKEKLLMDVINWCKDNPEKAKVSFGKSAFEVIQILKEIESNVLTSRK